jgi:hypothetical protein
VEVPPELLHRAAEWESLKRWERKELGQELRRLGFTYWEIRKIIPVPKGTLAGWCQDIPLTPAQLDRIRSLGGNRAAGRAKAGALLHQRNVDRVAAIRAAARAEAAGLFHDAFWVAGVVAYWGEGAKTTNEFKFTNSDPELVNFFVRWAMKYFQLHHDSFTVCIHFHAGQNEADLRKFWSEATGIPLENFRKGHMKAEGTGHRKKILYYGTAQVRVRRGTDSLHRVLGWIDYVAKCRENVG